VVVRFEFTADDVLVIVTDDCKIYMIKPKEEDTPITRDLTDELGHTLIEGAKVHENSLVLLTSSKKAYYIKNLTDCKPEVICEEPYEAMTVTHEIIEQVIVIDPSVSDSKELEVIFPRKEGGLYRIYEGTVETIEVLGAEKPIQLNGVKKLAITPLNAGDIKSQILAILTDADEIIISECKIPAGKAAKFPIEDEAPEDIVWCGADSVVLQYTDRVVIAGPNNAKAEFDIETFKGFYCYSEVDGLRILTNDHCFFIEKVPAAVEKSFETVSTDPSAQIISAYQKYLSGDPRAEDVLKGVKEDAKSSLAEGIKTLITAATCETEPEHQKYLLKAASFAKNFISPGEFNADDFVNTLKHLRIVNQLHVPKYGRMITYAQYKKLKTKQFIRALLRYQHHFLAFEICNHLGMEDKSLIYEDWAIKKIKNSRGEDEEKLLEEIKAKLVECPNLSYKKISMAAEQEKRSQIAIDLLKNEDSIKDQVPILLTMKQYGYALNIAVGKCEADIVYGIFSEMRINGVPIPEILKNCSYVEGATSYFLSYAWQRRRANPADPTLEGIYDFARKLDPHNPAAVEIARKLQAAGVPDMDEYDTLADILHTPAMKDTEKKLVSLLQKTPKTAYQRIKPFADGHLNFIEFKAGHISSTKKKGGQVAEQFIKSEGVFEAMMNLSNQKDSGVVVEAMIKKLKIDIRYSQMVRLRLAAKTKDWGAFLEIIKKEKPKFAPQYYARTCIEFGNIELATSFIKQVPIIEEKIDMLLDIEYFFIIKLKKK